MLPAELLVSERSLPFPQLLQSQTHIIAMMESGGIACRFPVRRTKGRVDFMAVKKNFRIVQQWLPVTAAAVQRKTLNVNMAALAAKSVWNPVNSGQL